MTYYVLSPVAARMLRDERPERWLGGYGKALACYGRSAAREAWGALREAGLFDDALAPRVRPEALRPLSTLELVVTHACNLACRYCYGSRHIEPCRRVPGLLYGARLARMSPETAKAGIDTLLAGSGRLKEVRVVFFGGEPFLNLPLIRVVATYAREEAGRVGKRVRFSAVTNATTLTNDAMAVVRANGIRLQVSVDGPPEIHDVNRVFRNGKGTYATVREGAARLATVQPGPPARATAAHGQLNAVGVMNHLREVGFGSVHVEPALWGSGEATLSDADIDALLEQEEAVAQQIVDGIEAGEMRDYHALTRLIRETRVIRERRRYYCGAGRGLVCLASDGTWYPCHRLAGREEFRLGTVETGLRDAKREAYRLLHVDARTGCRDCWARHLCGGGCWDHAIGAHGGLERPDEEKACRVMRRRIELAMAVNALLKESSDEFLAGGTSGEACQTGAEGVELERG